MFLKFKSAAAQSPKYRPEIDGLRAIAILPVVLYHAGISVFSGGFVGVDIFFVISGYLITSIIAKDIQQNKFSFATFYERRIRRIFPALFAMALFCVIVAAVLLVPKDFKTFGRSLLAMTVFASNLYFRKAGDDNGYFGDKSEMVPLLHTWSLAVEEQFYIFFPIGLILLHRYAKRHEKACLLLAALASFAISAWGAIHKPLGAFYLLPPRSWELLIGAFLALKLFPPITNRVLREIAGAAGVALIAYAVFTFTKDTDFPGVNALFPCVGAWLIIYATEGGRVLQSAFCLGHRLYLSASFHIRFIYGIGH